MLKDRSLTSAALVMYLGSDSSHWLGTSHSFEVYTSRSKEQGSSSSGKKVTEAVIWRTMAWISAAISFSGFSGSGALEGRDEQPNRKGLGARKASPAPERTCRR